MSDATWETIIEDKELSDLIIELPFVSEGLALSLFFDRLSDRVPHQSITKSLESENSEAANYLLYLTKDSKVEDGVTLMGALVYHMMRITGPLPIVTTKAIKEIKEEYGINNDLCVFRHYDMIKKNNPSVHKVIEKLAFETDKIQPAVNVLTLFYSAFQKQAELNKRKIN